MNHNNESYIKVDDEYIPILKLLNEPPKYYDKDIIEKEEQESIYIKKELECVEDQMRQILEAYRNKKNEILLKKQKNESNLFMMKHRYIYNVDYKHIKNNNITYGKIGYFTNIEKINDYKCCNNEWRMIHSFASTHSIENLHSIKFDDYDKYNDIIKCECDCKYYYE
jgi:hypothetical protein